MLFDRLNIFSKYTSVHWVCQTLDANDPTIRPQAWEFLLVVPGSTSYRTLFTGTHPVIKTVGICLFHFGICCIQDNAALAGFPPILLSAPNRCTKPTSSIVISSENYLAWVQSKTSRHWYTLDAWSSDRFQMLLIDDFLLGSGLHLCYQPSC